ncbi:SorB family sulfite dehydrogenase c-type cytochrome subunit [Pseudomonas vancouverensis]|uniref:Cytochrome c-551 n=1 Tax=Pseudomonas vancouverensis TaxID=95300 RepID=A0A1H2NAX4_PSEVA|nr:c-type cytochrome [Pseudomonas vancouverensis]KAB0494102.1 c-type cytochrome [Pseudomonas vancouverensis]TDB61539.1 c-type cytochrome [Pseudomonas vancouverensis]SDV02448.1 sulfite dehydrogenase (cytochrome) subunit SorB [Pseudomonas vancouverensis]
MNLVKRMMQLACAAQFCLVGMAGAAPLSITLPAETAAFKPSSLPGYPLAQQKCSTCHSADYINYQPPGMSLAQWTGEASKMQHVYGAPISDQDVTIIGAYLATTYGSAKASDADVQAASNPVPAATVAKAEPMTLLQNNGCLACHAVDHKVVGPAYHDVAAKYASDPQAQAKVIASIQQGGSGKWGEIPMPPFAQLSPEELQGLASFILHQ